MDVAAHVEAKARAAKEAAAALALAPTRAKNEALQQMARGLEEKTPAVLEANRADLDRARSAGLTRASLDRLTLTEARIEEMAVGLRHVAGAARPRRRDRRGLAAAERRRDRAGSRPPRRHRLHLRVPPQRHRGCRRALPQVRQCGAAARRQRGARVQHDHRADPGQGGREGGPAGRRHPVRRHARPRRRHGDAHARSLPRPHHSSGWRGVRAVGRGARDGARPQARQGALPRLRRRGRRSGHGAGHRPECQDPSGERVQCDGDPARPRRRRPGLPAHGGGAPRRGRRRAARRRAGAHPRAGRRARRRPPTGIPSTSTMSSR